MKFQEYMQLELKPNEKTITFDNNIKLDEKYEVAILDLIIDKSREQKYGIDLISDESFDIKFVMNVPEEGLSGKERERFYRSNFNTRTKVQLSEVDIWNLEQVDRKSSTVIINSIIMLFRSNPELKLSLHDIISHLNASFRTQRFNDYLQQIYSKTSGLTKILQYVKYPEFEIDGDLIHLHLPFYVKEIEMSYWLSQLTGIERTYSRQFIILPEAPLEDKTLTYKMLDPCNRLTSREDTKKDELYALVYCELIEYQLVSGIRSPLLRVVGLDGNKKGINWIQFNSPQYIPVKYQQFQHFDISVHDETGKQFNSKVYLTLHFRKV